MSRSFWFVAGAATGVYGLLKARRTAENFTPDGVGARVAAWGAGAREFGEQVRSGMVVRETELRHQLEVEPGRRGEVTDGTGAGGQPRAASSASGRAAEGATPAQPAAGLPETSHPRDIRNRS